MMKLTGPVRFVTLLLVFPVFLWLAVVLTDPPSSDIGFFFKRKKGVIPAPEYDVEQQLLPRRSGFDEKSCVSRRELPLYRRGIAGKPSSHLISKLRRYERRHKRCGPNSFSYNRTLRHLESGESIFAGDCKYLVWLSDQGLGNRMLTMASAFLYALLTDRVLLAERGVDMPDLFCEPFPEASWFLPSDFPFTDIFTGFHQQSDLSYGNLLNTTITSTLQARPYVYLHLAHTYNNQDELFFCDQHQVYLQKVPWLVMRSDLYFTPSLFLLQSFQQELDLLFPVKETVFHFLGRYLFHPTNSVWGLITRFHHSYLSDADLKVGIQVRMFDKTGPFTNDQILSCTKREEILPQITQNPINTTTTTKVAVVITSLSLAYFERIRGMYWENPTESGEVVRVVQPSHEMQQQTEKLNHDEKALAEIFLLSFMDKLVTSGWSTFGYVAQGLGGLRPWIMFKPADNQTVPEPPCARAMSMEPCFHFAPYHDCKSGERVDLGSLVPHVRHCEDRNWEIKLV